MGFALTMNYKALSAKDFPLSKCNCCTIRDFYFVEYRLLAFFLIWDKGTSAASYLNSFKRYEHQKCKKKHNFHGHFQPSFL